MFTPSELEEMPLTIQRLFSDLEMRVMEDIVDRIKSIDEISRTTDWRIYTLNRMGVSSEDIKKAIQMVLDKSDVEIDRIYDQVLKEGYARDKAIYEATGKPFIPYDANIELQEFIKDIKKQTKQEFVNLTQSMGIATDTRGRRVFNNLTSYYQRILDDAVMDITTGTFDYNSLIKKTIHEMTNSGIRSIVFETGYTNRVEVAARRALMTGVSQVLVKNTEQMAKDLETDYFEISWHRTARPTHQVWQGRVYSKQELIDICGLGTVTGLLGANCYHAYYPFIPGVSERIYTDEELDKMNAKENEKKLYKGKEYNSYEATQHQRKLETQMRAYKREIKLLEQANASSEDIRNVASKYQATMQEYVDFSKKMELPQEKQRLYTADEKDVGSRDKLANTGKYDIMKSKEEEFHRNLEIGNINTSVKWNKQREHLLGTKEWKKRVQDDIKLGKTPASSYLKGLDYNDLISNSLGKGKIVFANEKNEYPREYGQSSEIIGRVFNVGTGKYEYTKRYVVHYSKKGIHSHPVKEKE